MKLADVHDRETRRRNMAAIRARDTKPELLIRKALHARGFRYRIHSKRLPGKPDIVLAKYGAVVFVHGCFWHGHRCSLFRWPKTREAFWRDKISGNNTRDFELRQRLIASGWRVATIWECSVKGRNRLTLPEVIDSLTSWLFSDDLELFIAERSNE